jgi:hypothetical protein
VGFAARFPQTTADVDEALTTGLLSLDANVLLNFYRYSPNARDSMVAVLRAAGDRVWVSHQAAREFWRNRCSAIDGSNQATDQLRDAIDKHGAAASGAVSVWVKQTAVSRETEQQVHAALAEGYRRARAVIDTEVEEAATVSYDAETDSVLKVLLGLLTAHVGPPLPPEEHTAALIEGTRRAKEQIPPGFRDAEKAESGGPDGPSGDYLVWQQSIAEARRRDLPLVVVTADEKDDWWWRHRSSFLGPRSELVEEFAQHSDKRLFMLRPLELIQRASVLDVAVSDDAATDVARASSGQDVSRWTRAAVAALLDRLDRDSPVQADVIRFAAEHGGVIDRDEVYGIGGYREDRMLRGFTRPTARITRALQEEGLLGLGVEPALTPVYAGSATAVQFEIPLDIVEILSTETDE